MAALIEDTEFEWTDEDLGKLANQNLIRTLRSVEVRLIMHNCCKTDFQVKMWLNKTVQVVRDMMAINGPGPDNTWIERRDLGNDTSCMSEVQ